MTLGVPGMIGLRYARTSPGSRFASLVTLVSFIGLALGVAALIVVVSVMNGFDRELKHRILGAVPHLVVATEDVGDIETLAADYPVMSITPFSASRMLLVAGRRSRLVNVYGVLPERESQASILPEAVMSGAFNLAAGKQGMVIGDAVAWHLGIEVGDRVNLITPGVSAGGGLLTTELSAVQIAGIFSLGSELDHGLAVMHIRDLLPLTGEIADLRIMLDDIFAAPTLTARLIAAGYEATDWTRQYGDFFRAVRMEKIMMFVLLSFVIAVASFSIVAGLSMMVESKKRDMAVLRTMGLAPAGIMKIFLVQGMGVALSGVLAGLMVGVPLAFFTPELMSMVQSWLGVSIVEGTYFTRVPVDVRLPDVLVIVLAAFLISLAATLYPSYRASRLHPAEVLRYE